MSGSWWIEKKREGFTEEAAGALNPRPSPEVLDILAELLEEQQKDLLEGYSETVEED